MLEHREISVAKRIVADTLICAMTTSLLELMDLPEANGMSRQLSRQLSKLRSRCSGPVWMAQYTLENDDALSAIASGSHARFHQFSERSPRSITPERALAT